MAGAHSCRNSFATALPNHRQRCCWPANCSVFKAKIEEQPCIVKVFKSSKTTPLWRLVREARPASPFPHPRGRLTSRAEQAEFAQLYVQASCSAPPHDSVCRLLGWGSPDSADGTLSGLEEGAVIYMVLEDPGAEVDAVYPPEESLQYFKQIVSGPPRRFVTESFSALSGVVHAQACITCTAATSITAT